MAGRKARSASSRLKSRPSTSCLRQSGNNRKQDVDARDQPAHDSLSTPQEHFTCPARPSRSTDARTAISIATSAIHGVDRDLRDLADEFAAHGFIAAAPDLFWRTIPGPLTRADSERTTQRGQPRAEKIKTGEADMADTLAGLQALPEFNGRAAVMGFCYGGPYAILGRSGSVMPQAFHATAPGYRITSAISTASPRRSASSGAMTTTRRRRRCLMHFVPCRRA